MHLLYPILLTWALQIDMPSCPCTSPAFNTPYAGSSSRYALTLSCVICSTFLCRCLKSTRLDALMHLLRLTPPTFKSCFDTFVHFMRPTHLIVGTSSWHSFMLLCVLCLTPICRRIMYRTSQCPCNLLLPMLVDWRNHLDLLFWFCRDNFKIVLRACSTTALLIIEVSRDSNS